MAFTDEMERNNTIAETKDRRNKFKVGVTDHRMLIIDRDVYKIIFDIANPKIFVPNFNILLEDELEDLLGRYLTHKADFPPTKVHTTSFHVTIEVCPLWLLEELKIAILRGKQVNLGDNEYLFKVRLCPKISQNNNSSVVDYKCHKAVSTVDKNLSGGSEFINSQTRNLSENSELLNSQKTTSLSANSLNSQKTKDLCGNSELVNSQKTKSWSESSSSSLKTTSLSANSLNSQKTKNLSGNNQKTKNLSGNSLKSLKTISLSGNSLNSLKTINLSGSSNSLNSEKNKRRKLSFSISDDLFEISDGSGRWKNVKVEKSDVPTQESPVSIFVDSATQTPIPSTNVKTELDSSSSDDTTPESIAQNSFSNISLPGTQIVDVERIDTEKLLFYGLDSSTVE